MWLATGRTALQVQEALRHDPLSGHLFCFRGRRGAIVPADDQRDRRGIATVGGFFGYFWGKLGSWHE